MTSAYIKQLEGATDGTSRPLSELLDNLKYNEKGLVPAIAQDIANGEVLMLAWMNRAALERTLETGYAWYFSRSRQKLWWKGETSGHVQKLVDLSFDCDGDTILMRVEQAGSACHTYRRHCFYLRVDGDRVRVLGDPGSADHA